jgi:hypothetical protein
MELLGSATGKDNFSTKLKGSDGIRLALRKASDGGDDLGASPFPNKYQNIYEAAASRHGVVYVR